MMATNLAIDDRLILAAQKIGKQKTKKATVTEALLEYVARRKQLKLLDLFGSVSYDKSYHYKKSRRRK